MTLRELVETDAARMLRVWEGVRQVPRDSCPPTLATQIRTLADVRDGDRDDLVCWSH